MRHHHDDFAWLRMYNTALVLNDDGTVNLRLSVIDACDRDGWMSTQLDIRLLPETAEPYAA